MTLARSFALGMPAKVILVPLAKACGLVSQALRLSGVQVPPLAFSASEKAKPLSKVWQVRQTVVLFLPASALAAAKSDAIGSGAANADAGKKSTTVCLT